MAFGTVVSQNLRGTELALIKLLTPQTPPRMTMRFTTQTILFAIGFSAASLGFAQPKVTTIRFTLDWKTQGHHALFYIAEQKGYFKDQGLDVRIDQGEGSSATVTRLMSGVSDAGYGDINTAIEQAALNPERSPVTVYMMQYKAPLSLFVKNSVSTLKDVEGLTIGTSAGSAAVRLLPALAKANAVDFGKINIMNITPSMQEQMLAQGRVDGLLNFNSTLYMNLVRLGRNPAKDYRVFDFYDHGLPLYGNGIMVSRDFRKQNPEAVRGLVKAINLAMRDFANDMESGTKIVIKKDPVLDEAIENQRTAYIFAKSYSSPETATIGFGDLDDVRLTKTIAILSEAFALPRKPLASEVFDRSYLPPRAERLISFSKKTPQ